MQVTFLISLMVFVDVKHHVYLLTYLPYAGRQAAAALKSVLISSWGDRGCAVHGRLKSKC